MPKFNFIHIMNTVLLLQQNVGNSNSERRMNKIEYDIDFVPKQNAIC